MVLVKSDNVKHQCKTKHDHLSELSKLIINASLFNGNCHPHSDISVTYPDLCEKGIFFIIEPSQHLLESPDEDACACDVQFYTL